MKKRTIKISEKKFKAQMKTAGERLDLSLIELKNKIKKELKIDRQTMSLWYTGKSNPSTENLIYLRDLFQLDRIDELLTK